MPDSLSVFFLAVPVTIAGAAALWQRSRRAVESFARDRDRQWARLFLGVAAVELLMAVSIALGIGLH